jgi:hypothetical protein
LEAFHELHEPLIVVLDLLALSLLEGLESCIYLLI